MLLLKGISHEYYAVSPTWIVDWIVFDGHQVELTLCNILLSIPTIAHPTNISDSNHYSII
ncbi:hypothetical protein [Paenibacillus sedimenti]|uniref:hypothetical protein n=1 Tax=Paenibacillus sedimenti TaxID=2770274 RepID=UPI0035E3EC61